MNGTSKYIAKRRITEGIMACTEEGGEPPSFSMY